MNYTQVLTSTSPNSHTSEWYGQEEKMVAHPVKEPQAMPFEIPEGYVTGDEFVRRVKEGLEKRLKADGYL
jgi:hypothetical protein